MDLLEHAEAQRLSALAGIDESQQSSRGQYFTPAAAARLIAQLPRLPREGTEAPWVWFRPS
ncbi:hypothetical protein [Kocuria salsicia]|uniref:Uncharacterized protein n=1 Tax=Kocuria salsicia TaxID=664639 RepID=A0ABV3KF93_9MICC